MEVTLNLPDNIYRSFQKLGERTSQPIRLLQSQKNRAQSYSPS